MKSGRQIKSKKQIKRTTRIAALFGEGFLQLAVPGGLFTALVVVMLFLCNRLSTTVRGLIPVMVYGVAVPCMMLWVFRFSYSAVGRDLYYSFPQTKRTRGLAFLMAVLAWTAIICMVYEVTGAYLAEGYFRNDVQLVEEHVRYVWAMAAGSMLSAGAFFLALSVTGTAASGVICAVLLLLGPSALWNQIYSGLMAILSFVPQEFGVWGLLGSVYNVVYRGIFSGEWMGYTGSDGAAAVYSILLGLAYMAVGCVLHGRKTADQSTPPLFVSALRLLTSFLFTIPGVVFIVRREYFDNGRGTVLTLPYCEILFVIGIVLYFAYDLVRTRTRKQAVRSLVQFPVVLLLDVLLITGVKGIVGYTVHHIPDADKVTSVSIQDVTSYGPMKKEALAVPITDKASIRKVLSRLDLEISLWQDQKIVDRDPFEVIGETSSYKTMAENSKLESPLVFAIRQGDRVMYRYLYMHSSEYEYLAEQWLRSDRLRDIRFSLPSRQSVDVMYGCAELGWNFNVSENIRLYDCIREETEGMEDSYTLFLEKDWSRGVVFDFIECETTEGRLSVPISDKTPRTLELMGQFANGHSKAYDLNAFITFVTEEIRPEDWGNLFLLLYEKDGGLMVSDNDWQDGIADMKEERLRYLADMLSSHEETAISADENILVVVYKGMEYNAGNPSDGTLGRWYNLSDEETETLRRLASFGPYLRYKWTLYNHFNTVY